jgi:oxygen-independent coproporphyrinogen-3 oxidase
MGSGQVSLPSRDELERIALALGQAPTVAYSTTHVYPWAAPNFVKTPEAERERFPLGELRLYVHVPFCNYACTYCSYAIRVGATRGAMERYIAALEHELEWVEPGTPLAQLFVGGGTPTALPPDLLDRLLRSVFARAPSAGSEIHTVEASPETLTAEHLAVLRANGVGRVSMGIQSLDDAVLGGVHRRHSPAQALAACDLLAGSGLIFNIDLIYGLPKQTEDSFHRDLEAVAERGVHSVTLYDLRVNERTPVVKSLAEGERLVLERLVRWRAFVRRTALDLGFVQTRWHTFRRQSGPGVRHRRAPHFHPDGKGYQLGIGMSARSHLGYTEYRNHPRFETYLDRVEHGVSPVEQVYVLEDADRKTQFVTRSLGDGRPLVRAEYAGAFGVPIEQDYGDLIGRLEDAGLIEDDGKALALSETGRLVYDRVTLCFYPPKAQRWLLERSLAIAAEPG